MSHIMDKLKNLQTTVSGARPGERIPATARKASRAGSAAGPRTRGNPRLALMLLAIIAFGIIGYMAGMRSGRISPTESKHEPRVAMTDVPVAASENPARDIDAETETETPTVTEAETGREPSGHAYRETGRDEPLDPVIERTVVSDPPPAGEVVRVIAGAGGMDGLQKPVGSPRVDDVSTAKSETRIAELSGTIIRTSYEPITAEEDLQNKMTVMKLKVLGVVEEEGDMIAIISGETVKENDTFRGLTVEEITRDYVLFSFKDKEYRKLVR